MFRRMLIALFLLTGVIGSVACEAAKKTPTPAPGLPNPASVYCEQNGGKLRMQTDATGAVTGFCTFKDGSECDEWAYFRGECKPGKK